MPKWTSEAEMFAEFQRRMIALGWLLYPETHGHDLFMVGGPDVVDAAPGTQVVVEGKLRCNVTLLRQALPPDMRRYGRAEGADFYAVVVPDHDHDFGDVAEALGITVIKVQPDRQWSRWDRPVWSDCRRWDGAPLPVPGIALDVAAGAPAPRAMTAWKEAAVKACLTGMQRPIGAEDLGIARRAMVTHGWVERIGAGRPAVYRLTDAADRPDRQYPEVVEAIQRAGWTPTLASVGMLTGVANAGG